MTWINLTVSYSVTSLFHSYNTAQWFNLCLFSFKLHIILHVLSYGEKRVISVYDHISLEIIVNWATKKRFLFPVFGYRWLKMLPWIDLPVAGKDLICYLDSNVTLLSPLVQIQQVSSEARGWLENNSICTRVEKDNEEGQEVEGGKKKRKALGLY